MASRTQITVRGNVVADPTIRISTSSKREFATFRLASTARLRTADGRWTDGQTEWFDVAVFGEAFAINVAKSLRRGQPVIVTGRLHTSLWVGEVKSKMDLKIVAETVGHDLMWGRAEFVRVVREEGGPPAGEPPRVQASDFEVAPEGAEEAGAAGESVDGELAPGVDDRDDAVAARLEEVAEAFAGEPVIGPAQGPTQEEEDLPF